MATGIKNNSQSSSIKWVVEVYPFDGPVTESQVVNNEGGASTATGSDTSVAIPPQPAVTGVSVSGVSMSEAEINQYIAVSFGSDAVQISKFHSGIKSVSISKQKNKPDSACSFTVVGPLSSNFAVGNWVMVSSAQGDPTRSGGFVSIVRFLGQIERVDVSYSSQRDGAITTRSVVKLREWSTILTSRMVFDHRGLASVIRSGTSLALAAAGRALIADFESKMTRSFDPFESASIILEIVGCISNDDALENPTVPSDSWKNMALIPPRIPSTVLRRMGVTPTADGPSGASPNQYNNGFVKTFFGYKPWNGLAQGNWNGFFNYVETSSIERYSRLAREVYERSPTKIRSNGVTMNFQRAFTPWDLLSRYCEPVVNEVYVDLWHEYEGLAPGTGRMKPQPIIVLRDKPFALREIINNTNGEFPYNTENITMSDGASISTKEAISNNYTHFDDIARIRVKTSSVVNCNIGSSFLNSPNYIMLDHKDGVFNTTTASAESIMYGQCRLPAHQLRFGGQEAMKSIQFLGPTLGAGIDDPAGPRALNEGGATSTFLTWYNIVVELTRIWESYLYRMGEGVVLLKEDNYPLSVGFNMQFTVGYFDLVGHIEAINTNYAVGEDGSDITTTEVRLSRIVFAPRSAEDNTLKLFPLGAFGRLFDPEFADEINP